MTPPPAHPLVLIAPDPAAAPGFALRGLEPPAAIQGALAAAADANPNTDVFLPGVDGRAPDRMWRGRRCRAHERNLESLRFAAILPPGALAVRLPALATALAAPLPPGADAWRELTRRLCAATRVVRVPAVVSAGGGYPAFAPAAPCDVLVMGQIEVSTSLYFDFLEASPDLAVRFRALTHLYIDAPHLAAARLVVLTRTLHRFWDEGVIAFLEAAGTPWAWFTDDNFQALAAERAAPGFFTAARMRRALAGAVAVWASTPALAAALDPLHPRVEVWGPVRDPVLALASPPPTPDRLTIAVPGGDFRVPGLAGGPARTMRRLAGERPLRLIATAAAAAALAPELPAGVVVALPMERSFRQFVRQWRRFAPDLVLHPAGATANAAFKAPTAAIVAGYLGAIPVVADEPAYGGWGEAEGIVGLEGDGLATAAQRVRDPVWRAEMQARLGAALAARFGEAGRIDRLRALGGEPGDPDAALGATRRRLVGLRIAQATRRIRDRLRRRG